MNQKMTELLHSFRTVAEQAGETAADAAYGVSKKTGELLSVAKMNIQLVDLKAGVNTTLRELGELLYSTHTGTPVASEVMQKKLEDLDVLNAQIAALEAQLGKAHTAKVCGTCGAAVKDGDAFCRTCGGKLN